MLFKAKVLCLAAVLVAIPAVAKAPFGRYVIDVKNDTVTDTATKRTWQRTVDANLYSQAAAKTYCNGLGLASGWHLPDVRELYSLVDQQQKNPAIDPTAFPLTPVADFWSATPLQGAPASAWLVHFSNGATEYGDGAAKKNVRCVK